MIEESALTMLKESIGRNVRRLRRKREMTQEEFAAKVGLSRVQLNRCEKGHNLPNAASLFAIADSLGVTVDEGRLTALALQPPLAIEL